MPCICQEYPALWQEDPTKVVHAFLIGALDRIFTACPADRMMYEFQLREKMFEQKQRINDAKKATANWSGSAADNATRIELILNVGEGGVSDQRFSRSDTVSLRSRDG